MSNYNNTLPFMSTLASTLPSTSAFWAMVPQDQQYDLLLRHLNRAEQEIGNFRIPEGLTLERLKLTVMLAVEAEVLFFNAAVFEPSQDDRDSFFADYLRRALQLVPESIQ